MDMLVRCTGFGGTPASQPAFGFRSSAMRSLYAGPSAVSPACRRPAGYHHEQHYSACQGRYEAEVCEADLFGHDAAGATGTMTL